ncbi:MAG: acyl-CoA dehydrogenase C-terminal domain-containing protein [Pseudomonadota bacterium]
MSAPLNDIQFVLYDVLDYSTHYAALGLQDVADRDTMQMVMEEADRFAQAELAPINAPGDAGCRLQDGEVSTPAGFKEAYQKYIAGGWAGLCGEPEYGGQGMPEAFGFLMEEITCTANMAWTMYPGLSRGCIAALAEHGSAEQKGQFLPKLLTGEWTGTMCLTEPHAGSDVGLARTRAELQADSTYRISGTKIFISAGEHDMAENIVHLVLARTEDAPAGTRGISMFVVPKVDLDGSRNRVTCGNIEEKMGIHGNATCELLFEDAVGYLVGEEHKGMRYMFTMMNAARLAVGLQGVSVAQAAFNKASVYAAERLQMRSLAGPQLPDKPADPILVHPDVRRLLLTQRAIIEGGRAMVYYVAQLVETTRHGADSATREKAQLQLDFLTPIAKALLTELGFECANHAVQVFGGHGYIKETGVEQYVRDLRIALLYEGTTGIQALDLVGRKMLGQQGAGLQAFGDYMLQVAAQCATDFPHFQEKLTEIHEQWAHISMDVGARAMQDPQEVGAASVDYLFYSGYAVLATFWAKMAVAGQQMLTDASADSDYGQSKVDIAEFYFARILPRQEAHRQAMVSGAANLIEVNDLAFQA